MHPFQMTCGMLLFHLFISRLQYNSNLVVSTSLNPPSAEQFDSMVFHSEKPMHETINDILNKPVPASVIEEEAIGHLSFSDLSDETPPMSILDLSKQYKKEGNRAYEQRNYTEAIEKYTQALSYNSNDPILFCTIPQCA